MNWKKIDDSNIRHVWICEDEDCDSNNKTVYIEPSWYTKNGTPVCECGVDMVYSHTEINI